MHMLVSVYFCVYDFSPYSLLISHSLMICSNTRFHDSTIPVFEQLEKSDIPIYNLDGTQSPDEVWNELLVKCPQIQSREMRYRDAASA